MSSRKPIKVPPKAQRRVFARETLLQARKCDEESSVLEAEFLYTEGMQMLRELISEETSLPKREQYCQEQRQYERRLFMLQTQIHRHFNCAQLVARYTLSDGARGHSYHTLFQEYMNDNVKELHIYEPYLSIREHFRHLVSFLESVLKCCRNCKYIRVFTRPDSKNTKLQLSVCKALRHDLSKAHVTFSFRFRQGLTERKIVLGNGIIIKTDHGLHIYQPNDFLFTLGVCDYDFRKCYQTEVDVWATRPFYEPCTNGIETHGDALCLIFICLGGIQKIVAQNNNLHQTGYLDVETPNTFNYNSPLQQPDSLRNQPYFDFLSTLYRRDTGKNSLFQPYLNQNRRQRRSVSEEEPSRPSAELLAPPVVESEPKQHHRAKRVVIFRPLFVYRQQQVRREARRRY